MHGIFDSAEVSGRLIQQLSRQKGLVYMGDSVDRKQYRESQLDLLADTVRKHLQMKFVYSVLEEGI